MRNIDKLLEIMAALRDPNTGCPWDLEQDFGSIAPYTIEEAYEVADAIDRDDMQDLRDELGDLLLQVVYHSQMANEQALFSFDDVAAAISDKLVRRHPHVFAGEQAGSPTDQHKAWEVHKAAERQAAAKDSKDFGDAASSALAGLTTNLPALTLAAKTGKKAASVGFDWEDADDVIGKIHEELAELEQARASGAAGNIEEEFGDLLLAMTSLARHLQIDPEQALRSANRKFSERFVQLESSLRHSGDEWSKLTATELDSRWQLIKAGGQ
jgi:MazG family protein